MPAQYANTRRRLTRLRWRAACTAWLSLLLAACVSFEPSVEIAPAPLASSQLAYLGVVVEPHADGLLVVAAAAGPAAIAGIKTNDVLLELNQQSITKPLFDAVIEAAGPGGTVQLKWRRADQIISANIRLADRAEWTGPAYFPRPGESGVREADKAPVRISAWPPPIAARQSYLQAGERLRSMFAGLASQAHGPNKREEVISAFAAPSYLSELTAAIHQQIRAPMDRQLRTTDVVCSLLRRDTCVTTSVADDVLALPDLVQFLDEVGDELSALYAAYPGGRSELRKNIFELVLTTSTGQDFGVHPHDRATLQALQASLLIATDDILKIALSVLPLTQTHLAAFHTATPAQKSLPPALQGVVSGRLEAAVQSKYGWIVFGGPDNNTYDMSALAMVVDVGGDDIYEWPAAEAAGLIRIIVDHHGDDHYSAARAGPAGAITGISLLRDFAGNDRYASTHAGCGTGIFGFGLIRDDAGHDEYHCSHWGSGAAAYGFGLLLDLGQESDRYHSGSFSQGLGGPGGSGILLDAGGDDHYYADGAVASAYGTANVYMSFSQGVGFGFRPWDHGGFGALYDLSGHDHYRAGEFSQGGAYFWGLGVLFDLDGDDYYRGNRYSQGFAAHQAIGIFQDFAGDDHYWSVTAAGQGAAWDQSLVVFSDHAGHDHYRAQALSQGAAAQQSMAYFQDFAGNDYYLAEGSGSQGGAGGNSYHFDVDDPIYSLGVLVDHCGRDYFSSRLSNNAERWRAGDNEQGSGAFGIALAKSERAWHIAGECRPQAPVTPAGQVLRQNVIFEPSTVGRTDSGS